MKTKSYSTLISLLTLVLLLIVTSCSDTTRPDPVTTNPTRSTTSPERSATRPPRSTAKPQGSATVSEAERLYAIWLSSEIIEVSDIREDFITALANFAKSQNDQTALYLARDATRLQISYDDAQEVTPPATLKEVHSVFLMGLSEYNAATVALLSKDADEIAQIPDHLDSGERLIFLASQMLSDWWEDSGS